MKYIHFYEDGSIAITDNHLSRELSNTLESADNMSEALRMIAERYSDYDFSPNNTVSEEIISENKAEIEKLKNRIKMMDAWSDVQRNVINAYAELLRRTMSKLAVQNAVQNTHYERNKENVGIIRSINTELSNPMEVYFTEEYKKNDDIPF